MKFSGLLVGLPLLWSSAAAEQEPLMRKPSHKFDLISELKKAEIIPTVLDEFQPFLNVSVSWKKAAAGVGNTVKPKKVQEMPKVSLSDELPELSFLNGTQDEHPQLTLVLTDPDARSRDDPDWSEMCHWIATEIPLTPSDGTLTLFVEKMKEIMPYKPPGPPPKTGKHRYVFAALAPQNGTFEPLNLTKPAGRQHWGYGYPRMGLRQWADDNGLVVIGANFVYAQHKKQ